MSPSKRAKAKDTRADTHGSLGAPSPGHNGSNQEVLALKQKVARAKVKELTNNNQFADFFTLPDDFERCVLRLREELCEVPVVNELGFVTNPYLKLQSSSSVSDSDKELIWRSLAVVREAFFRADAGAGYQSEMNWKHTRAELDQVLEAAILLKLDKESTADAILASIFSDSVKDRGNFITHNVDGARGAAQVLVQLMHPASAHDLTRIERVSQAVLEHQVAPPEFMARIICFMLISKLGLPKFDPSKYSRIAPSRGAASGDWQVHIAAIYQKISDPFNQSYLNQDLTRIEFSPEERELLSRIGIQQWYVPHPQRKDSRIAHAVIAGDHSINYNHPEGFAKIAWLRGPGSEAVFEDPTILDSLYSAVTSFADSFRVLLPEVQPMAMAGLRRTQAAVERVTAIMRELFWGVVIGPKELSTTGEDKVTDAIERAHDKHPELFTVECLETVDSSKQYTEQAVKRVGVILQNWLNEYGEIPFNPKDSGPAEPGSAKLPFWNAPLTYPLRDSSGALDYGSLNDLQRKQFLFAMRIREIAVELLRAEQWIY
jgi:hypothetical protein